jgi:hypothetical protein
MIKKGRNVLPALWNILAYPVNFQFRNRKKEANYCHLKGVGDNLFLSKSG